MTRRLGQVGPERSAPVARHADGQPEQRSEITCPHCGHRKIEVMPTDACQFFYACEGCSVLLRPLTGHCCVFCSYGSVPCPPVQLERSGRGHGFS